MTELPNSVLSPEAKDALFTDLRGLKAACDGTWNSNELATMMIFECLRGGLTAEKAIVGVLTSIGLNNNQVGAILRAGSNFAGYQWKRTGQGQYALVEEVGTA